MSESEDLDRRAETLLREMAEIDAQLDAAVSRRITTGDYADAEWFARAKAARRFKGQEHQRIMAERRKVNAARKAENIANQKRDDARLFVTVAKRRLSPEAYTEIWAEVKAIMEADGLL